MPSLFARFRSWLGSVEFAATTSAIVVALLAAGATVEFAPVPDDALYVLFIAGVAAPGIYRDAWPVEYDRRVVGFAWGAVAALVLAAAYLALATGLRTVVGDPVAPIASFIATWFAGIIGARAAEPSEAAD